MLVKTRAIVLHHIKYAESSVVAYFYTEKYGRASFMVKGIKGKKSKFRSALLQPLSLLQLEMYHKEKRELQTIKDANIEHSTSDIHINIHKSTVALFIAEMLYKTLREEEPNPALFEFLYQSVLYLDTVNEEFANFHLLFIIQLTKFYGFHPENNYSAFYPFFDLQKGRFINLRPTHNYFIDANLSVLLSELMKVNYSNMHTVKLSAENRKSILVALIQYFQLHFQHKFEINSLEIFHELFH